MTLEDLGRWVGGLIRTQAQPAACVRIDPEHIDQPPDTGQMQADTDYFQVRIHRMHLMYDRQWLERFAPLLLVAVEFSYDGQNVTRPAVIGPEMIDRLGRPGPADAVIAGTVVAGPHPLRAGGVSLTMAMYRVARGNVVGGLLDVLQGATSALDLAAGMAPFTAMATVVVDGVTALTGADSALIARREQFPKVEPVYLALIESPRLADPDVLFVANGELMELYEGRLYPYRRANYVLYSIDRAGPADVDTTRLPLHRQWLAVLDSASKASTPETWETAKANLSSLVGMAFQSPDLTYGHAEKLEQEWTDKVIARRDQARRRGDMGQPGGSVDDAQSRALAILRL